MRELVRLILMLGIAASAVTFTGAAIAWWMEEPRRMARLARRVLGGAPDGLILAQGRGAAAAFRLEADRVLVMRDGGAHALLYPIARLLGAELLVDEQVVARVAEGEPRRLLDRIPARARQVALRLIFDDARHPDFNLDLWLPGDEGRRHARPAPIVIQEARAWLGRAEALLRRHAAAVAVQAAGHAAAPPERPAPPSATQAVAPPPVAAPPVAEPPPWEDDEDFDEIEDGFEVFAAAPPEPALEPAGSAAPAKSKAAKAAKTSDQLQLF